MIPLARNIIRYMTLYKEAMAIFAAVILFSVATGMVVYGAFEKTVAINDDGKLVLARTMKYTVNEVLNQKGIVLGPYDDLNVGLDGSLQRTMVNDIYIKRAVPISIMADGKEERIFTSKSTVFEAIRGSNIPFSVYDRIIGAGMSDKIVGGMNLSLVRISEKSVVEKSNVPFGTVKRESKELASGEEKVVRGGTEGLKEKTYRILIENGKEIARQLVAECVLASPVDRVVEFGNKNTHRVSRGGVIRYERVIDMITTAYTACYDDTGKSPGHPQFGITYTGVRARKGIVAVDPRTIPLGSRLYVEVAGDTPDYGYCVAADTGGAVKGNILDLYFEERSVSDNWGARRAKVYVLSE